MTSVIWGGEYLEKWLGKIRDRIFPGLDLPVAALLSGDLSSYIDKQ